MPRVDRDSLLRTLSIFAAAAVISGVALLLAGGPGAGAIVAVLGVGALSFLQPRVGLWAVVLLFPLHPLAMRVLAVDLDVQGLTLIVASTWKEAAVGGLVAGLLARAAGSGFPAGVRAWLRRPPLPDLVAVALIVLVLAGVAATRDARGLNEARLLLFPVAVYVGVRAGLERPRRLLAGLVAIGAVIAIIGIIQSELFGWSWVIRYYGFSGYPPTTFVATGLDGPRAVGTLGSPNEFAFVMAVDAVLAAVLLVGATGRRAILLALALAALLLGTAMSFSRTAILALGIGLISVLIVSAAIRVQGIMSSVRRVAIASVPAILLALVLYATRGGAAFAAATVATIGNLAGTSAVTSSATPTSPPTPGPGATASAPPAVEDPSVIGHVESVGSATRLLVANPVGIGFGRVGARPLPGEPRNPTIIVESWYLTLGLSLGWIGLAWAVAMPPAFVGFAVRRGRRAGGTDLALACVGVTTVVAVIGLLLPSMTEPQLAMLPWIVAGAATLAPAGGPDRDSAPA